MSLSKIALPYEPDSFSLANKLSHLPWFVFLDSCHPHTQQGRYDILSACPYRKIIKHNHQITISESDSTIVEPELSPFKAIKNSLPEYRLPDCNLPFVGGAIGFFGYDVKRTHYESTHPTMMFGIYDWAIVVDHEKQETWCVSLHLRNETNDLLNKILSLIKQPVQSPMSSFELTQNWQTLASFEAYQTAFFRIKDYIRDGDCYQVNLSQCFQAQYRGSPWSAYQQLRRYNPNPFSAYLQYPELTALSLSPERFLSIADDLIQTEPIKGTIAHHQDPNIDLVQQQRLYHSEKDRAENIMIVDLLRNDLSKNATPGSVQVPHLFEVKSFKSIHHLVSTITARMKKNTDRFGVFQDCFPGGSITGAPKKRAMEIIQECETHQRGIYCGSIAYFSYHHHMDSNITIRTLTFDQDHIYCPVGGAIVADSTVENEYQECLDKIDAIFKGLHKNKCHDSCTNDSAV